MSYLVIGFIPDHDRMDRKPYGGVHTPLRSESYYRTLEMAQGAAELWAEDRLDPRERVAVVQVVYESRPASREPVGGACP